MFVWLPVRTWRYLFPFSSSVQKCRSSPSFFSSMERITSNSSNTFPKGVFLTDDAKGIRHAFLAEGLEFLCYEITRLLWRVFSNFGIRANLSSAEFSLFEIHRWYYNYSYYSNGNSCQKILIRSTVEPLNVIFSQCTMYYIWFYASR